MAAQLGHFVIGLQEKHVVGVVVFPLCRFEQQIDREIEPLGTLRILMDQLVQEHVTRRVSIELTVALQLREVPPRSVHVAGHDELPRAAECQQGALAIGILTIQFGGLEQDFAGLRGAGGGGQRGPLRKRGGGTDVPLEQVRFVSPAYRHRGCRRILGPAPPPVD